MISYGPLAKWYDALTADVPYGAFADFYEAEYKRCGGDFHTLLDLCCGTGTLTRILAERGYEMIAVDASEDMLMEAREKSAALPSSRSISARPRRSLTFTARWTPPSALWMG